MNRDQKAAVVEEIAGQIEAAEAIFAVEYRGLSVPAAAQLRAKLRDADATFRVVKNPLSERAADRAGAESLKPLLEGPTALTLVRGDAALAAKAISDMARVLRILEFKGGLLNGNTLTAEEIRAIAQLPAREVLNAQLVGTIAAPLTGLVRGLNALISGLAIQLKAIADQGLVSGPAAPAEVEASEADTPSEAPPPADESEPAAQAAAEPEAAAAPEAAAEPEAGTAPEAAAEPEVGTESEAAVEPEPASDTEETEQDTAPDADRSDA
jgi:large subunit ribosomal protein L10